MATKIIMINIIQTERGEKLFDLHQKAQSKLEGQVKLSNLILHGQFDISEIESDWISDYTEDATKWQSDKCHELIFTHGEFLNKYKAKYNESAIDYIIKELKDKPDSNRACWSLFDMSVLLESEDKSIPSFMILQLGISEDKKHLIITAYYRALEILNFLPLNMAELCLIIKDVQNAFSYTFETFSLTINAFNAYCKEGFSCLKKAEIDMLLEREIMSMLCKGSSESNRLKDLLKNKKDITESRIESIGIKNLLECLKQYELDYADSRFKFKEEFISAIKMAAAKIKEYNSIIYKSTYTERASKTYDEFRELIVEAMKHI